MKNKFLIIVAIAIAAYFYWKKIYYVTTKIDTDYICPKCGGVVQSILTARRNGSCSANLSGYKCKKCGADLNLDDCSINGTQ